MKPAFIPSFFQQTIFEYVRCAKQNADPWGGCSESYLEASDCDLHESKQLVFSTLGSHVVSEAEVGRNSHHTLVLSPWASYLLS